MMWIKVAALTAALTAGALLFHPFGIFGGFWPPSPLCPLPTEAQFPFYAAVAIIEASAFGLAISFLVWGWPLVAIAFAERWRRFSAYLGFAWQLGNWYPHDALHIHIGPDLQRMVTIELGFHVTLIATAVFLMLAVLFPGRSATTV